MNKQQTALQLVEAAEQHFTHAQPPEHDANPLDNRMYQYKVARDAALFFDKQRKLLLEELTDGQEEAIGEVLDYVVDNNCGAERALSQGDMYYLHLKVSAPPKSFSKAELPAAIREVLPDATPQQIRQIVDLCTISGTPRKTFEVISRLPG